MKIKHMGLEDKTLQYVGQRQQHSSAFSSADYSHLAGHYSNSLYLITTSVPMTWPCLALPAVPGHPPAWLGMGAWGK